MSKHGQWKEPHNERPQNEYPRLNISLPTRNNGMGSVIHPILRNRLSLYHPIFRQKSIESRKANKMITTKEKRQVNKQFRSKDESNLWPISGRFNATDRAIRRLQRLNRQAGYEISDCKYSYELTLENEISKIVNDTNKW